MKRLLAPYDIDDVMQEIRLRLCFATPNKPFAYYRKIINNTIQNFIRDNCKLEEVPYDENNEKHNRDSNM